LREVATLVKGGRDDVEDKVRQLLDRTRRLEKEIATLKQKLASGQGGDLSAGAVEVHSVSRCSRLVSTVRMHRRFAMRWISSRTS